MEAPMRRATYHPTREELLEIVRNDDADAYYEMLQEITDEQEDQYARILGYEVQSWIITLKGDSSQAQHRLKHQDK